MTETTSRILLVIGSLVEIFDFIATLVGRTLPWLLGLCAPNVKTSTCAYNVLRRVLKENNTREAISIVSYVYNVQCDSYFYYYRHYDFRLSSVPYLRHNKLASHRRLSDPLS